MDGTISLGTMSRAMWKIMTTAGLLIRYVLSISDGRGTGGVTTDHAVDLGL